MKTNLLKTFFVALCLFSATYATADDFEKDGIRYEIISDSDFTVAVTDKGSYMEYSGDVIIPATVYYYGDTYSVTSIGEDAFNNCTGLTSITIPNSVTTIGDYAFEGCTGLKEVHISDLSAWCKIDFENYYSNPFYYAHNLYLNEEMVTDLVIPSDVTEIKKYAFYGCTGLTSITIPNSVTSIGYYAFRGCTSLTSITIGNSVTSIGYSAFYGCSGLTSITIPSSVTSIGDSAFCFCI